MLREGPAYRRRKAALTAGGGAGAADMAREGGGRSARNGSWARREGDVEHLRARRQAYPCLRK